MKIIANMAEWQTLRHELATHTIGFVPTMGFLHQGHASLIKKSKQENDVTIVSIFVNPTQFNDPKDYDKYPRNTDADCALLESLDVDYLLLPNAETIYPTGNNTFSFVVNHPYAQVFEGVCRPGHFSGVVTVVLKLLNIAQATNTYFGEKDYQQYQIIKEFVAEFFIPTNIVACATIREISGLPLSSRNSRLSQQELMIANEAAKIIHQATANNIAEIKTQLQQLPLNIEYLDAYDGRIFSAIKIGDVRLIDNF